MANPQPNGGSSNHVAAPRLPKSKTSGANVPAILPDGRRRLVNYEELLRLFECPVCHDWVTPPIAQCRKGHVVCGPCKKKGLTACPCCKQRFSEVPNWMMEQISAAVAFPCKFQGPGWQEFCVLVQKTGHEALCSFRPVNCQYSIKGCTQVLQFHLMENHVQLCPFRPRLPQSVSPDE